VIKSRCLVSPPADPAYPAYKKNAVITAIRAAEEDPSTASKSITSFLYNINCNSAVPGASGFIAFQQATGNQIDKAMPIPQIKTDASLDQIGLVWSEGYPLNTAPSCR
jgi:hypothetical protein